MARRREPLIVAVSGQSGSGKTRLLARLIPALARRGVSTAVLKHTRHPHAFDRPGKDTDVLRRAGAVAAAIDGPGGMAYFGPPAGGLRALARFLPPVDLILAEGWKDSPVPRIEVHRRSVSRTFLCTDDPRVLAIVTDEPPPRDIRTFRDGEEEALAAFLRDRLGLGLPSRERARLRSRPPVSRLPAEGSGRTVALGRRERMAKMNRKRGGRAGRKSRQSAGRKGGRATLRARGPEFYSEIGRKGGKRSGSRRGKISGRSARKATGSGAGSRSRRRTRSMGR